jgi:negative regulator of sigma E activity
MNEHREAMIRALTGEADEQEAARLLARLEQEPELQAEYDGLQVLRRALSGGEKQTFGPFFAARVMNRLERERNGAVSMYESLRWVFARIAVAGLVACVGLGVYNTVIASNAEIGNSAIESALGVPAENLETVYLLASE